MIRVKFNIYSNKPHAGILKQAREISKEDIVCVNKKDGFKYVTECYARNGDFIRIIKKIDNNKELYTGFVRTSGPIWRLYKPQDLCEKLINYSNFNGQKN